MDSLALDHFVPKGPDGGIAGPAKSSAHPDNTWATTDDQYGALAPPQTSLHRALAHDRNGKKLQGKRHHIFSPLGRVRAHDTTLRNDFVATIGEFVGTTMFLFVALGGTNTASYLAGNADRANFPQTIIYYATAQGLGLLVTAFTFYRVSGSLFNPAITLSLFMVRVLSWRRAIFLLGAQIAAGIAASALIDALLPVPLVVSPSLGQGTNITQGLFLEAFLTAYLCFTVLMCAAEKHRATFIAPIIIGLALFVIELFGVVWSGAAVNPARAFGPCVVTKSFPGYHWIYWAGPFIGSIFATLFYVFLKWNEYEQVVATDDCETNKFMGMRIPHMHGHRAQPVPRRTSTGIAAVSSARSIIPRDEEEAIAAQQYHDEDDVYEMKNLDPIPEDDDVRASEETLHGRSEAELEHEERVQAQVHADLEEYLAEKRRQYLAGHNAQTRANAAAAAAAARNQRATRRDVLMLNEVAVDENGRFSRASMRMGQDGDGRSSRNSGRRSREGYYRMNHDGEGSSKAW
ncbi:Aquaporin-1 [Saitoella coloradoensis]